MIRKLTTTKLDSGQAFKLADIHPLTDFKRNTTEFRERLKSTGRPEVLTVDGRADLVIQDVESYQKLLDELDRLQIIDGIRRGLMEADKGLGVPMDQVAAELRAKFKLPPRNK